MSRIRADLKKTIIQPIDKPLPKMQKKRASKGRISISHRDSQRMMNWLDEELVQISADEFIIDDPEINTVEKLLEKAKRKNIVDERMAKNTFHAVLNQHYGRHAKSPGSGALKELTPAQCDLMIQMLQQIKANGKPKG